MWPFHVYNAIVFMATLQQNMITSQRWSDVVAFTALQLPRFLGNSFVTSCLRRTEDVENVAMCKLADTRHVNGRVEPRMMGKMSFSADKIMSTRNLVTLWRFWRWVYKYTSTFSGPRLSRVVSEHPHYVRGKLLEININCFWYRLTHT
jgi:hypothetical protein